MNKHQEQMGEQFEMKEASPAVFENKSPKVQDAVSGEGTADLAEVDQAPGGDSRPDQTDPEGTRFVDATADPNLTSSRDAEDLPPVYRDGAEEYDERRSDDNMTIIARPNMATDTEIAELEEREQDRGSTGEASR